MDSLIWWVVMAMVILIVLSMVVLSYILKQQLDQEPPLRPNPFRELFPDEAEISRKRKVMKRLSRDWLRGG